MKVKSRMSCPVRRKDGTWTTVINLKKIFRISDEKSLSATNVDALIIRNVRKRFVKPGNTTNRKTITHVRAEVKPWLLFLCKGENYACQRSDKSGYSGRS